MAEGNKKVLRDIAEYILGDAKATGRTCVFGDCEETDVCSGCGYCHEHHYLSVLDKVKAMREMASDEHVKDLIDIAANLNPESKETEALYRTTNTLLANQVDKEVIIEVLTYIHALANS